MALAMAAKSVAHPQYQLLKLLKDEKSDCKMTESKDKVSSQLYDLQKDLAAAKSLMRSALKDRPITVKMCADFSFTTTAATVYNTVANLVPGLAFGFSSFAALFDEYKTTHIKFMVQVGPRVNIAQPMIYPRWTIAVDFAVNTAATSIVDNMQQSHVLLGVMNTNGALTYPNSMTESGLRTLSVSIPPGPMADVGIVSDLMSGIWVPASDSSAIVAYALPYFESGGGLSQFTLQGIIEYTVAWRLRG